MKISESIEIYKKRIQELIYERDMMRETRDLLLEENAKLKQLLNEGHASLMKENEELRWANALKDSMLYIQDKVKKPKE